MSKVGISASKYRGAQGHVNRLPSLAEELVQLKVDAIIVATEAALLAAKRATSSIPIVAALFDYDPVAAGVIDSLSHPGGNITGVFTRAPELMGKRLELLKEAVPALSRVAVLHDAYGRRQLEDTHSAARGGADLHEYPPIHLGMRDAVIVWQHMPLKTKLVFFWTHPFVRRLAEWWKRAQYDLYYKLLDSGKTALLTVTGSRVVSFSKRWCSWLSDKLRKPESDKFW